MTQAIVVESMTWFIFVYFILLNGGYLFLNYLSMISLFREGHEKILDQLPQFFSGLEPPISIIIPAYNEATTIVSSVRSMLQLIYFKFEIIVVNDGSQDATLEVLKQEFDLHAFPQSYHAQLKTQPIHTIYRSARYPELCVIDKANGGKADSLNAGINLARYPLFCGVDADSILQRDSLQQVVRPFLLDPQVVATGGTVRIANGCEVHDGFLTKINLPSNIWALFQVVEYIRAFLFGRLGWSKLGGMLIISGAFGLFRKETIIEIGGYRTGTIGEDMELIVRMHRLLRRAKRPYKIVFLANPICWTEAPEDLRTLKTQRVRWERGLSESLAANIGLMFSRNGGVPGWMAFPFIFFLSG